MPFGPVATSYSCPFFIEWKRINGFSWNSEPYFWKLPHHTYNIEKKNQTFLTSHYWIPFFFLLKWMSWSPFVVDTKSSSNQVWWKPKNLRNYLVKPSPSFYRKKSRVPKKCSFKQPLQCQSLGGIPEVSCLVSYWTRHTFLALKQAVPTEIPVPIIYKVLLKMDLLPTQ